MAEINDGALDLSSKPPSSGNSSKTTSPSPSLSPEPGLTLPPHHRHHLPAHRQPGEAEERSESVSSDGHETDGSTTTKVQPIAGPFCTGSIPASLAIPPPVPSDSPGATENDSPLNATEGGSNDASGNRPFKMYPFDAMSGMYSHLAAAATAGINPATMGSAAGLMNPFAAAAGSPLPFGLLDSAISLSSPIGQYLAQRKRRAEAAQSNNRSGNNGNPLSPGSKSNVSDDAVSTEALISNVKVEQDTSSPSNNPFLSDNTSANHLLLDPSSSSSSPASSHGPPSAKKQCLNSSRITKDLNESALNNTGDKKDDSYWERRRKNNEAAKRSRDARRAKEEEIALRAAYLEQENLKLRAQVAILKNETAKLHYMLYNRV